MRTRGASCHTSTADSTESAWLAPQGPQPLQYPSTGMRVLLAHRGTGALGTDWILRIDCLKWCREPQNNPMETPRVSGGGVWRAVPMAGGSSSARHIHGAPRQGKLRLLLVVCGNQAAAKGVHLPWGTFHCTVPMLKVGRTGFENWIQGDTGSIHGVCGDTELAAKSCSCLYILSHPHGCSGLSLHPDHSSGVQLAPRQNPVSTAGPGLAMKAPWRSIHLLEEDAGHMEEGGAGGGLCA